MTRPTPEPEAKILKPRPTRRYDSVTPLLQPAAFRTAALPQYDTDEEGTLPALARTVAGRGDRPALICFVDREGKGSKASENLIALFGSEQRDLCLAAKHYFRTLQVDASKAPALAPSLAVVSADGRILDTVQGKAICPSRLLEAMGKAFPAEARLPVLLGEWRSLLKDLSGLDDLKRTIDLKKWEASLGNRPEIGKRIAALQQRLAQGQADTRRRQSELCDKVRLLAQVSPGRREGVQPPFLPGSPTSPRR